MLARAQQQTGLEHYWAIDGAGRIYEGNGQPDYVLADSELEVAYDDPTSSLRYHHSHPDERALSPSDLGLLGRIGVREVWAHTVGGASYGAALTETTTRNRFRASLEKLQGHMVVELVNAHCSTVVTPDHFEMFRDMAACEALQISGIIMGHIRLSDAMRRHWLGDFPQFIAIRNYFESVLP